MGENEREGGREGGRCNDVEISFNDNSMYKKLNVNCSKGKLEAE